MFIEQPPLLYRIFFPEAIWRIKRKQQRVVYLTFDDGPIPEVTPWVLDTLDKYNVKATFFMVGDNVRRHPWIFEDIKKRGHSFGNHTMRHLKGLNISTQHYLDDIDKANKYIDSILFRPPHGLMRPSQARAIKKNYNIVMHDLVTRDYSHKLNGEEVLNNVKKYARNGSIIVFHDSLRAERNLKFALPRAIKWLKNEGYEFSTIPM